MISDLRVTTVENSTSMLNQKSGQTTTFGISQEFDEIYP
jgi:hypothetical protein